MEELKLLFRELAVEYQVRSQNIITPRVLYHVKSGNTPSAGKYRYTTDPYTIYELVGFHHYTILQALGQTITKLSVTKKIVEYIIKIDGWINKPVSYESELKKFPSIHSCIAGGFLLRNFELNNGAFQITDDSFNQAYEELLNYIKKDSINISTYLSLHGPAGDIEQIQLAENAWIIQADTEIVKLFNRNYSTGDGHYIDMFEKDYVLKINYTIPKKDWQQIQNIEDGLLNKWFMVALLSGPGNVEKGKRVRISSDWPLLLSQAPDLATYHINRYDNFRPSFYKLTNDGLPHLIKAIEIIHKLNPEKLDKKITHSLDWLTKSKSSHNLDDKVVQLALTLEYLINTIPSEVTLQLRAKTVILLNTAGEEEEVFETIKHFSTLRNKIVHGNDTLPDNQKTRELITKAEIIILALILRMIELNYSYSYKQISDALHKALYHPKNLDEILSSAINK